MRLVVPDTDQDLVLRVKSAEHNPPLISGTFRQEVPAGVRLRLSSCRDRG